VSRVSSAAETLLADAARCRAGGVDGVTLFVRGVPRETGARLLRRLATDLAGFPRQTVVDVDRCGDVAAITLLADAVPAFLAALRTLSAAAVLTHLAEADPASASFFGATCRRGLSPAAANAAARECAPPGRQAAAACAPDGHAPLAERGVPAPPRGPAGAPGGFPLGGGGGSPPLPRPARWRLATAAGGNPPRCAPRTP